MAAPIMHFIESGGTHELPLLPHEDGVPRHPAAQEHGPVDYAVSEHWGGHAAVEGRQAFAADHRGEEGEGTVGVLEGAGLHAGGGRSGRGEV